MAGEAADVTNDAVVHLVIEAVAVDMAATVTIMVVVEEERYMYKTKSFMLN